MVKYSIRLKLGTWTTNLQSAVMIAYTMDCTYGSLDHLQASLSCGKNKGEEGLGELVT
jgi:hypothetical protein